MLLFGADVGAFDLKARRMSEFQALDQEELFWRRPRNQELLVKQRRILVSATRKNKHWLFKGGGQLQVPAEKAFASAKEFNRLSRIPEHFSEIHFEPSSSILSLKVHFLGFRKNLKLLLFEQRSADEKRIYFRSVGDWMKGMEGVLIVKDLGRQASEVGILGRYSGDLEWVPNFVLSVGAEGVMHHVAETLRNAIETDYKFKQKP